MSAYFDISMVRFGYSPARDIIRDLSIQIQPGEMVGIIGPNGAGKSTLLYLMNGLLSPSAGEVLIQDEPAAGMDPRLRARAVGFVPQAARVLFPYTVAEIVAMGRHPHSTIFGDATADDHARIEWAMEVTGTAPFAKRLFHQLSGGEAQRVVLARALAQDAPALLLDEPTSSLDLYYQAILYGLLEKLNFEQQLTVVIVTHDINLAAEYCPRLIGIRDGQIIADGPPDRVVTTETIGKLYDVETVIVGGMVKGKGGGRKAKGEREEESQNPESRIQRESKSPSLKSQVSSLQSQASSGFRLSPFAFRLVSMGFLFVGILFALKIGGGAISISWAELFRWMTGQSIDPIHADVLQSVRLPRVLMAALAGGILACAGVLYQALLRNPLADPYTLGVSGGATLGAVLAISVAAKLGQNAFLQNVPIVSLAALAGALVSVIAIYALARSWGLFSTSTLILAGVTLNMIFASMILLIEYYSDFTQVYQMIRWMMGGLDVIGFRDFRLLGPMAAVGFALAFFYRRDLDLLSVDPIAAAALGVRVAAVRWQLLLAASLMTGAIVASAGPIGFVGLVIPHAVRLVAGASHRRLLPASILAGALFLLACDTLAQNLLGVNELPVGVITSMLGGPFFIYLLLRRSG